MRTKPTYCTSILMLVTAVFCAAGVSSKAVAQTSVDRSFAPSPKDCADVRWAEPVLRSFPSIADACQAVEQRHGKTYVKLEGTVEDVRDGGKQVQVDFKDGSELSFTPTPRTTLYIDGQRTSFGDLEDGTKLNFYIPEDRLQAELQPEPDRLAFIIVPIEITPAPVASSRERTASRGEEAQLPSTAGPLPMVGWAGVILILLGAVATVTRKLRSQR